MGQSTLASNRDRRAAPRTSTTLRGKVFPGGVDCTISDFNKLGARLRFAEAPPEDETLVLVVWSSGQAFEATVRWRSDQEIGLHFEASRDLRRPAPPHLAEIQEQWLKRRPRIARRELIAKAAIIDKPSRWPRRAGWQVQRPTGPT